jgi:hypothetical protein
VRINAAPVACQQSLPYNEGRKNWSEMTAEELQFIADLHAEGRSIAEIRVEFQDIYERLPQRRVVEMAIREQGLPAFLPAGEVRCPTCGAKIVSQPCIACTVRAMPRVEPALPVADAGEL